MGLKLAGRKPNTYRQHGTQIRLGWIDTWRQKRSTCQQCIVLQISSINDRQTRKSQQRRGEQSGNGMVEMERSDWCDLRQETFNKNEAHDIRCSDSTDVALRLLNMANVSQRWKSYGNNRDENGAIGNGGEPVRTAEKWRYIVGSKGGTDSDGREKAKVGMVRTRYYKKRWNTKHPSSWGDEDGWERPRGRPKFRSKDSVRKDLKAWGINEEWSTDRERWKCLGKTRYPA